ncbi:MAG: hypothetical protein WB809_06390 [Thermoplasmata archaeon]
MSDRPPWERVAGDRANGALFRWVSLLVLCGVLFVGYIRPIQTGLGRSLILPSGVVTALVLAMAFGFFFELIFPTQFPTVLRLGISPTGIQVGFPLRLRTVKWSAVKWVGPN